MQLHIRHETHYTYDEPVSYSIQALKLTPRSDWGQRIVSWRVSSPGERIEQFDPYGNLTHIVTFEQPHREMRIVVEGVAEIDENATTGAETARLSPLAYMAATPLTRPDAGVRALSERCLGRHPASRATLSNLVHAIGSEVAYQPGITNVTHGAAEALELGVGVCQDQAHVLIHSGDRGEIASHAWADVWLGDEQGWLSLDVTHAEEPGGRHCRLAVGRDYLDAAPVRGVRRGGGHESMSVAVRITNGQASQQ
jgi:transglutaminase-like putative cysteine protease